VSYLDQGAIQKFKKPLIADSPQTPPQVSPQIRIQNSYYYNWLTVTTVLVDFLPRFKEHKNNEDLKLVNEFATIFMGSTNIKRMCWEKAHILSAQELYYLCILF
jgi:hypothetical protein